MSLLCPHCGKPVQANPLGRWYARFICPHCRRALRFDARTNRIGIAGSAFFFIGGFALVMGDTQPVKILGAACLALWLASLALSFALRRIVKG